MQGFLILKCILDSILILNQILIQCCNTLIMNFLAERQGFEPWVHLRGQRFSRPPHSTALASLRIKKDCKSKNYFSSCNISCS